MQREWRGPWGVRASSKAGRAPGLMAVQKPWKTPVSGRPHWLNRGLELEVGVSGPHAQQPGAGPAAPHARRLVNGDRIYRGASPFLSSRQERGREIKAHLTPCCQPETLTNPSLPKTIIGQNNSSLEINWTNYVGSQNPLNDYPLSGRASVANL